MRGGEGKRLLRGRRLQSKQRTRRRARPVEYRRALSSEGALLLLLRRTRHIRLLLLRRRRRRHIRARLRRRLRLLLVRLRRLRRLLLLRQRQRRVARVQALPQMSRSQRQVSGLGEEGRGRSCRGSGGEGEVRQGRVSLRRGVRAR